MATPNLLSAGLIVAAMLATPVMARDNAPAHRHLTEGAANAAARHVEGHAGIYAPHAGALTATPADPQGYACDVGDTVHMC
jgi:hypothetical protein